MTKRKYYAVLIGAQIEPEINWVAHHIIYSSLKEAKAALQYWTDRENFDRVPKCKIVEIRIGKEVKIKKGLNHGTMTLPKPRKRKKK